MIKPNRHYIKTKQKCARVRINFTVDGEGIKIIINGLLNEISLSKWAKEKNPSIVEEYRITDENKITRKMVEDTIRKNLYGHGDVGCSLTSDQDYEFHHIDPEERYEKKEDLIKERKDLVDKIASKLFPDWFPPPNSVRFIKE